MKLYISGDICNKPQNQDLHITYTQCIFDGFQLFSDKCDPEAENLHGYDIVVQDDKFGTGNEIL